MLFALRSFRSSRILNSGCVARHPLAAGATAVEVAGVGVCWPNDLGACLDDFLRAASAAEVSTGTFTRIPMFIAGSATSACAAELSFGRAPRSRRFVYFFVSAAVHGAVALNGSIHPGRSSLSSDGEGASSASICGASLTRLEATVRAIGLDASAIWTRYDAWPDYGAALNTWIANAGAAVAQAAVEAASVVDIEAAVVDGIFPTSVRARVACAASEAIVADIRPGAVPIEIREGSVGPFAPSLGAASLPLLAKFSNGELGAGVVHRSHMLV